MTVNLRSSSLSAPKPGVFVPPHVESGARGAGAGSTQGLRFVGLMTARQEVAERIQTQLIMKRQLRQAWLREQQMFQGGGGAAASLLHTPMNASAKGTSAFTHQMLSDYQHFLSGRPAHLSLNMAHRGLFPSRRQIAERLLSRFYGLSGKSMQDEVESLFAALAPGDNERGNPSGGGLGQHTGGGGNGHFGTGEEIGAGEEVASTDAGSVASASDQPSAVRLSSDLKQYLLAEIALTQPDLHAEQRLKASGLQSALMAADGAAIEAAKSLAIVAVERAQEDPSAMVGRSGATGVAVGGSLHDVCHHLLSVYSADAVMKAIASLINSVEVLGNARAYKQDGLALSDCLTRIRNLSVIMLIMEKTERLKSRLLFGLNTGRLPSDEAIWRAICKMTQSRSIEPVLTLQQEGDMSPLAKRMFLQEITSILRDLPVSVWPDKDARSSALSSIGDMTEVLAPMRPVGNR